MKRDRKEPLFIGVYNYSCWLTYLSVVFAILAIMTSFNLYSLNGVFDFDRMNTTLIFMGCSGICDLFDGTVARMCKRTDQQKEFGVQIDSLADTVAFVVTPAIVMLNICKYSVVHVIIAIIFILCGIIRLGWFNVITEETNGYFKGLPTPSILAVFPIYYLISKLFLRIDLPFLFNNFDIALAIIFALTAFFYVFNIKFKKPGKIGKIALAIYMVIVATLIFIA